MSDFNLGPVRRWKVGDILFAENDLLRMAYVSTDDPGKVGAFDWYGPDKVGIEYIAAETAQLWDDKR